FPPTARRALRSEPLRLNWRQTRARSRTSCSAASRRAPRSITWTPPAISAWPDSALLRLFRRAVRPRALQSILPLRLAPLRQGRRGPAPPPAPVRDRRERLPRQHALELLFLGRELEVRGLAVRGERRVDARSLEGRTVEVGVFGRSIQRRCGAAQI